MDRAQPLPRLLAGTFPTTLNRRHITLPLDAYRHAIQQHQAGCEPKGCRGLPYRNGQLITEKRQGHESVEDYCKPKSLGLRGLRVD